jgi:hypothetical protein
VKKAATAKRTIVERYKSISNDNFKNKAPE